MALRIAQGARVGKRLPVDEAHDATSGGMQAICACCKVAQLSGPPHTRAVGAMDGYCSMAQSILLCF